LLPNDHKFEHGGAKLSFPTCRLTSLLPCTSRLPRQNGEICLQNHLPISGKPSITNYLKQWCWFSKSFGILFRYIISKTSTTFPLPEKRLEYG